MIHHYSSMPCFDENNDWPILSVLSIAPPSSIIELLFCMVECCPPLSLLYDQTRIISECMHLLRCLISSFRVDDSAISCVDTDLVSIETFFPEYADGWMYNSGVCFAMDRWLAVVHWDGLKNNFSAAVGMSLTHLRNQKKERPKSSGVARIMDIKIYLHLRGGRTPRKSSCSWKGQKMSRGGHVDTRIQVRTCFVCIPHIKSQPDRHSLLGS